MSNVQFDYGQASIADAVCAQVLVHRDFDLQRLRVLLRRNRES